MIDNTIFTVNSEPYCIWEFDLKKRNIEFINGLDPEYFNYVTKIHLEAEDEKRASIALRASLHHAMETMFSLLGAYVQAPDCAYAWIAKCSNMELRDVVSKIVNTNKSFFTKLNIDKVTWENISKCVFQCYLPNTDKQKRTIVLFAKLWQRLAYEFVDQNHIDEYNSIKHGFRVKAGGFSLAGGIEHEYGVSPPAEEMKTIGHSDYGTSFVKLEKAGDLKGNRSLISRRICINWKIEKVILLLQLVTMSINNVVCALKIANGAEPGTCKFIRPQDDANFDQPWSYSPGVISCNFDLTIDKGDTVNTTKHELNKQINTLKANIANSADAKSRAAD